MYFDVFNFGPKFLINKSCALDKRSVVVFDKKEYVYWYISTEPSDYLKCNLNLVVAEFLEYYYTNNDFNVTWWADELLDFVLEVIFRESQFSDVVNEYFRAVELKSYNDEKIEDLVDLIEMSQTYDEYIKNITSLWHYFHTYTDDMEKVFIKALEFAICDDEWQDLLYDCTQRVIFNYNSAYDCDIFWCKKYLLVQY